MLIKKICCIGANQIGGPLSCVIACKCPEIEVRVVDKNEEKIMQWNSGKLPVYEPGLEELVLKCRNKNLFFMSDLCLPIREADIIFLCVTNPMKVQGTGQGRTVDLKYLEDTARLIANTADSFKIIVEKSTTPVRAAETVATVLKANQKTGINFQVLSNPEFSSEGAIIHDLLHPERIVIGGPKTAEGAAAIESLVSIYEHWVPRNLILVADTWSSELSKLATSAFLAQKISSINSLSQVCESTNSDISDVALAVGMDSRIGPKYLNPSIGFGGANFHHDILSLVYLCQCLNLPQVANYWKKILDINDFQKRRFAQKIIDTFFHTLTGKQIAILGFSYKKNTADTKESPAIYICKALLDEGAKLQIYDPAVKKRQIFKDLCEEVSSNDAEVSKSISVFDDPYDASTGTHGVIVCSGWDQFKSLNYNKIYSQMMKPAYIFDGFKMLPHKELIEIGFNVTTIGKNLPQ